MGIRKYNPTTPGRRGASVSDFAELTPGAKPEKIAAAPEDARRAAATTRARSRRRHRGGGHKRAYRLIDFRRNKDGVAAKVDSIQYDPNRTARIALLNYVDGEKRYIVAPHGLKTGDTVMSGDGCAADGRQLLAAVEDSAGHGDSQHRTAGWPRRRVCAAVPARAPRSWLAKPAGLRFRCRAAKFAVFRPLAGRRSARPSNADHMRIVMGQGRPQVVGWAVGRTFAARR